MVSTVLRRTRGEFASEYVERVSGALIDVAKAEAASNTVARRQAVATLSDVITHGNLVGHMIGSRDLLADAGLKISGSGAATQLPRRGQVPFWEAIRDIAIRVPRFAEVGPGGVPAYAQIAEIYRSGGSFGLSAASVDVSAIDAARIAAREMTERVQGVILEGAIQGRSTRAISKVVSEVANVSESYATNVVRTNLNGAYSNGTLEQASRPTVQVMAPALMYSAVQERWDPKSGTGTRPNHAAARGMVLPVDHPLMDVWRTPNGYQCRCRWVLVTLADLRRMGLWDEDRRAVIPRIPRAVLTGAARPDPGFA